MKIYIKCLNGVHLKIKFDIAIPYLIHDTITGNHILSKINDNYYDINGIFNIEKDTTDFVEMENDLFLDNYIEFSLGCEIKLNS